jgi:hypothetical protein
MANLGQVTTLLGLGADAMDNMYDVVITPPKGMSGLQAAIAGRAGDLAYSDAALANFTIRAEGFEPPKYKIQTYKVGYKGVEIDRPKTKLDMEREFELSFRLDANYQVYQFLSAWRSQLVQASSGYVTNALWGEDTQGDRVAGMVGEINSVFGSVTVTALSRPIYMAQGTPFQSFGVTEGKMDGTAAGGSTLTETTPLVGGTTQWKFAHVWLAELDEPSFKNEGGDAIKIKAKFKFGDLIDPAYSYMGSANNMGL